MPASLDRRLAAVTVASTESAGPAPPLREMRLELKSEANQTVELRIGGRGDDVRVELRTEDSGLAETFREDLPQLVERIERHGVAVETSGPAGASSETRDIRASETFEAGTDDRPRKEHGSSDTQGQHQRRRRNDREALFEDELAAQGGRSK